MHAFVYVYVTKTYFVQGQQQSLIESRVFLTSLATVRHEQLGDRDDDLVHQSLVKLSVRRYRAMAILHGQSVTPRHLETYNNDDCHGCVPPILSSKLKTITVVSLSRLIKRIINDVESLSDHTGQLVISRVTRYGIHFFISFKGSLQ